MFNARGWTKEKPYMIKNDISYKYDYVDKEDEIWNHTYFINFNTKTKCFRTFGFNYFGEDESVSISPDLLKVIIKQLEEL